MDIGQRLDYVASRGHWHGGSVGEGIRRLVNSYVKVIFLTVWGE